jgi:SNF2 family DNA or RNA helicase
MGTRKTSTSINIVDTLHVNGYVRKALVIAPLSIVDTWGNKDPKVGELAKHSSIKHLTFTLTGTKSNKDKVAKVMHMQAKSKAMQWTLINPESIGKRVKIKKKKAYQYNFDFENLLPDVVIIDESTIIQNHDTARGELIERLLYLAPYKIIMSGNPIPKGGHQVFGQYLFMDKGIYGDNYFKFKNKFFEINYFKGIDGIKPEKEKEFNELFHSGCFVVRKDECLELPPKVYERRYYQMSPEQAKAYAQMKKDAVATMDDLSCSAEVVITKYLRLSQIAGGFLPLEDEMGKLVELRRFKDQPGLDLMIVDLLSLPTDEQVVIWARFKEEIEMIQERLTKEGIVSAVFYGPSSKEERIEARRQFRDKEIKAIVCSSAAARGLNDFIGSNYSFRYSNDYSADNRGQSEDRQHRSGVVGEKVLYVDYVAQGTIDEDVLDVLQSNKDYSTALLELRKSKKNEAASD